MPNCQYKFVSGAKKNTTCDRFIRAQNSILCYQHKTKITIPKPKEEDAPKIQEVNEVYIAATPLKSSITIKRKGKPVKINDGSLWPEAQRAKADISKPKEITTKTNDVPKESKPIQKPIIKEEKPIELEKEESYEELSVGKVSSDSDSDSYSISDSSSDLDSSSDSD